MVTVTIVTINDETRMANDRRSMCRYFFPAPPRKEGLRVILQVVVVVLLVVVWLLLALLPMRLAGERHR
jgi:hypothetical protein